MAPFTLSSSIVMTKSYFVLRTAGLSAPLVKCKRVFQALVKLSVEELCETGDSLIAPVRLGVARPTAPFTLSSSTIEVINVSTILIKIYSFIRVQTSVESQIICFKYINNREITFIRVNLVKLESCVLGSVEDNVGKRQNNDTLQ